jgi:hypothetical protein
MKQWPPKFRSHHVAWFCALLIAAAGSLAIFPNPRLAATIFLCALGVAAILFVAVSTYLMLRNPRK